MGWFRLFKWIGRLVLLANGWFYFEERLWFYLDEGRSDFLLKKGWFLNKTKRVRVRIKNTLKMCADATERSNELGIGDQMKMKLKHEAVSQPIPGRRVMAFGNPSLS